MTCRKITEVNVAHHLLARYSTGRLKTTSWPNLIQEKSVRSFYSAQSFSYFVNVGNLNLYPVFFNSAHLSSLMIESWTQR